MKEMIDIAKLLKDCPKGMELYSTVHGKMSLEGVSTLIQCKSKDNNCSLFFYPDGRWIENRGECILFPSKENRDWSTFQRPFKDGDIVANQNNTGTWIGIYHRHDCSNTTFSSYCYIRRSGTFNADFATSHTYYGTRFATEKEKEKLFKAIKDSGYKWNPETKTLDKLCPFNAGDVLVSGAGNIVLFSHIDDKQVIYYHCILGTSESICIAKETDYGVGQVHHCKLATDKQRDILFDRLQKSGYKYNPQTNKLEKLIKPKFKVGDRIKLKNTPTNNILTVTKTNDDGSLNVNKYLWVIEYELQDKYELVLDNQPKFKVGDKIKKKGDTRLTTIKDVRDNYYIITIPDYFDNCYITDKLSFSNQYDYELVPNKFDINTLVPFESKVLVREDKTDVWRPTFYGTFNQHNKRFYTITSATWRMCIPYNKDTKHLIGTTNDCADFYKTWE